MAEPNPINPEEMARLLRANIQKRRPRSLFTFLMVLGVCALPLALIAWWSWPRPELPRLVVIAFDQLALAGHPVPVRAWVTPQDANLPTPDLRDVIVSFEEFRLPQQPGAQAPVVQVRSDRKGEAMDMNGLGGEDIVEFKVSHADPRQRYRTEDRARVFARPADTPLLLVEVAAVAKASPDAWRTSHIRDLVVQVAADKTLQVAQEKHYQVVYLAAGAASPMVYRKMRGWVETKAQEERLFPDGPVLGQLPDPGEPPQAALWAKPLAALKRRFRGIIVGVAKDARLGEVLHAGGATTYLVGAAGEMPPGITRLPSWEKLPAQLLP
jgi:hypothetical protein